eukprot:2024295-Rhodomonas_salina.1
MCLWVWRCDEPYTLNPPNETSPYGLALQRGGAVRSGHSTCAGQVLSSQVASSYQLPVSFL